MVGSDRVGHLVDRNEAGSGPIVHDGRGPVGTSPVDLRPQPGARAAWSIPGVTGVELSDPMAQLMAEGLSNEFEAQIKRTPGVQHAGGSSLNALVEVRGFEPLTS